MGDLEKEMMIHQILGHHVFRQTHVFMLCNVIEFDRDHQLRLWECAETNQNWPKLGCWLHHIPVDFLKKPNNLWFPMSFKTTVISLPNRGSDDTPGDARGALESKPRASEEAGFGPREGLGSSP